MRTRLIPGRPYRAPELLFGPQRYDAQAIDVWAIGVTLAEFFTGNKNIDPHFYREVDPLEELWDNLPGRSNVALFDDSFGDIGLAASIFRLRGSPNDETWPVSVVSCPQKRRRRTDPV